MLRVTTLLLALGLPFLLATWVTSQGPPSEFDRYNLVWNSPGETAAGSVPMGNGRLGANVWATKVGEVHLLLSRTDSWSEASRLLKLGMVTLKLRPPTEGETFEQTLLLREGTLRIRWGDGARRVETRIWFDPIRDLVHIRNQSESEGSTELRATNWRNEKRTLAGEELRSSWTMQNAPANIVVEESADFPTATLVPAPRRGFIHRNEHSVVPLTLAHQGLKEVASTVHDPILHRTFGLLMGGVGAREKEGSTEWSPVLIADGKSTVFQVAAPCVQGGDVSAWVLTANDLLNSADSVRSAEANLAAWQRYWGKSWILTAGESAPSVPTNAAPARDPAPPSRLTQALVLQQWVQRCGGLGPYPIKFNGSIFTVEPEHAGGPKLNSDWRKWGDCYWWQNTRLPYHAMLAQSDFEGLDVLFDFYQQTLPFAEARARVWHGVQGAWIPETMTPFGAYANQDYGWDRTGHEAKDVLCPWWCYAWNQGPELLALMLDRMEYAPSARFLKTTLVPAANSLLAYFDTRFPRTPDGKLRLTPTQSLETYWEGVVDDLPTVAGLHHVIPRLLNRVGPDDGANVERWKALLASLPPVPVHEVGGERRLAPAAQFDPKRSNVENPELAAIWPFRLYGLGSPDLAMARATFSARHEKMTHGWTQDGQQAARLGLTDEAARILLAKLGNSHPKFRFPAMWGPNFDWLPDQCHGSNLLIVAQTMLLQPVGEEIWLLPAWPIAWDVNFRLAAPHDTRIDLELRNSRIHRLEIHGGHRDRILRLPPELAQDAERLGHSTFAR